MKLLPSGEPAQLTHDPYRKMGPMTFTADNSRVVYTSNTVNTWSVPTLGGEPTRVLNNAASLAWIKASDGGKPRVLFTSMTGEGLHMGVFTASEDRSNQRTIYLPDDKSGMAHRAALSPDGRSVLVVEMDMAGWRAVPAGAVRRIVVGRTRGPESLAVHRRGVVTRRQVDVPLGRTPAAASTSGASDSRTALLSRSRRARPKNRASPSTRTARRS